MMQCVYSPAFKEVLQRRIFPRHLLQLQFRFTGRRLHLKVLFPLEQCYAK